MRIRTIDDADQDLISGFQFYEKQDKGLGGYFLDTLSSDIDSLQLYFGIHQVFYHKYHRLLSSRFPFAVYYTVQDDIILIHAVLDCRRDPSSIRKRLNKR